MMMIRLIWFQVVALLFLVSAWATGREYAPASRKPAYQQLPPLREQAAIQDAWTQKRISHIPSLLHKYGVDAWLMSQKEYAEDTVFWSLKSAKQFSARRRTTTLFIANATDGSPSMYNWVDNTPEVWSNLLNVLEAQDIASIAVNVDADIAFSSGLHTGEYLRVVEQLGPKWAKKLVNVPMLGVEFIATMVDDRLPWYRRLQSTAWSMISEAFSEEVIVPGETTTADVEWWLREKIQQQNYTTWFMPDVSVVRPDTRWPNTTSENDAYMQQDVINFGDLLHVDFGVTALGMNTDTQHLAYVLYPGETEADIPRGLLDGLKKVNRIQDVVKSNMKVGATGNEILKICNDQLKDEGIEGRIYSHPIGDWGHSAGTLIGMVNLPKGVPVLGDLPLLKNTYYSVELYAEHFVPERNGTMIFALEEDIYWVEEQNGWDWVWARQDDYHVIRTKADDALRVQQP